MVANDHGNTPLHYACYWRFDTIALVCALVCAPQADLTNRPPRKKYLVEKGALVLAANKYGKTPLQRAGEKLSAVLKEKAVSLGQSLAVKQMQVRNTEEAGTFAVLCLVL